MNPVDFFYANILSKYAQVELEWSQERGFLTRITAILDNCHISLISTDYEKNTIGTKDEFGLEIEGNEVIIDWEQVYDTLQKRRKMLKKNYEKGLLSVNLYVKKPCIYDLGDNILAVSWWSYLIILKYEKIGKPVGRCKFYMSMSKDKVNPVIERNTTKISEFVEICPVEKYADELMSAVLDERGICGD